MISAQDKILYVANKLGLSSLKDMQGSTGAIYDCDVEGSGLIFNNASQHGFPTSTNVTDNKFEVNEALLVETIAFYAHSPSTPVSPTPAYYNFMTAYPQRNVIVFDLVIGNKVVMKDIPVFSVGSPQCFASVGITNGVPTLPGTAGIAGVVPRHQIFMEGVGILIPPQVEFYIQYRMFNVVTGANVSLTAGGATSTERVSAYLFGTKVNLNFNTSI